MDRYSILFIYLVCFCFLCYVMLFFFRYKMMVAAVQGGGKGHLIISSVIALQLNLSSYFSHARFWHHWSPESVKQFFHEADTLPQCLHLSTSAWFIGLIMGNHLVAQLYFAWTLTCDLNLLPFEILCSPVTGSSLISRSSFINLDKYLTQI